MLTLNQCDGCTFCCSILGVVELKKPPNTDCQYCPGDRCAIHNDLLLYPATCKDFECGYLVSGLPPLFRPDHCHIMITGEDADLQTHVLHVDPKYPNAPNTPTGRALIDIVLQQGHPNIILITGTRKRIISRDAQAKRLLRAKLKKIIIR